MSATLPPPATLDDLMRTEGKAELINGRIVRYMSNGFRHSDIASEICTRLRQYAERRGVGHGLCDGTGYAPQPMPTTGRQSFCPDASYFVGTLPEDDGGDDDFFIDGLPTLAVEVRSRGDQGPAAEAAMARKRAEYFAAGTLVVWDVDRVARVIRVYRPDAPDAPAVYAPGDEAEAEPACPGWRLPVAALFPGAP